MADLVLNQFDGLHKEFTKLNPNIVMVFLNMKISRKIQQNIIADLTINIT